MVVVIPRTDDMMSDEGLTVWCVAVSCGGGAAAQRALPMWHGQCTAQTLKPNPQYSWNTLNDGAVAFILNLGLTNVTRL